MEYRTHAENLAARLHHHFKFMESEYGATSMEQALSVLVAMLYNEREAKVFGESVELWRETAEKLKKDEASKRV